MKISPQALRVITFGFVMIAAAGGLWYMVSQVGPGLNQEPPAGSETAPDTASTTQAGGATEPATR